MGSEGSKDELRMCEEWKLSETVTTGSTLHWVIVNKIIVNCSGNPANIVKAQFHNTSNKNDR